MATLVLVTGMHFGGWSWKKVTPLLRAAGHEVSTPTLTGLGERVHLTTPDVDLATHVTDVVNLLVYEDLSDVTLVGYSYGATVVAGVAERVPERRALLVFGDGAVPADGQSDYEAGEAHRAGEWAAAASAGTPGYAPAPADRVAALITDEADRAWVIAKMTPHPLATLTQPLRLGNPATAALPRAFVYCPEGKEAGDRSRASPRGCGRTRVGATGRWRPTTRRRSQPRGRWPRRSSPWWRRRRRRPPLAPTRCADATTRCERTSQEPVARPASPPPVVQTCVEHHGAPRHELLALPRT
jgi:pimeloyl-ACP methyl ester carboxylesterase